MSEAELPLPTGEVEVVPATEAVEIVEDLARDRRPADRMLIALDVDGTVILEDESLSPGVVEAVEHARRAGHEVMIATGRNWDGTRGILEILGMEPEYVVCANGAVIMRRTERRTDDGEYERFHTETFDATDVLALLRRSLPDANYVVETADGMRLHTKRLDEWSFTRAQLVPFEQLAVEPVTRVVVISPQSEPDEFADLIHSIGLNQVTYSVGFTAWLDIAPDGVDKGTALERVRQWLGATPEHVLVMGDGRNDLGMFAWARNHGGRAIAMAQGPEDVRAAATETTLSVHEGGVAAILRAL